MNEKGIKKRANIGIRRKRQKGFEIIKKAPSYVNNEWPELIIPIPTVYDRKRRSFI